MTLFGWKGNRRPGGSNGSLLPGDWLKSPVGCTPGSASGPTLGNEHIRKLPFFTTSMCSAAVPRAIGLG